MLNFAKQKTWILGAVIVPLLVVGCMGEKKESSVKSASQKYESTSKKDLHKAALLNVEMGDKYLSGGQVARAKAKFVHALELDPKLPEAHSSIAYYYEFVGDYAEARSHHKKAISYSSANKGRFYNNYGTFLCRQRKFQEAEQAFKNALADKSYIKTAEVYENQGMCALKELDTAKARQNFQLSLRHDPTRDVAALELAQIEIDEKNFKVARNVLIQHRKHHPDQAKSLWLGIQAYKALGDEDTVATMRLKLKSMFKGSDEYLELLRNDKG